MWEGEEGEKLFEKSSLILGERRRGPGKRAFIMAQKKGHKSSKGGGKIAKKKGAYCSWSWGGKVKEEGLRAANLTTFIREKRSVKKRGEN